MSNKGGRPKSTEPYTQWKVHIPATLAARVEQRLFDPVRGKPRYGERGQLISELLNRWLADQENAHVSVP